MENWGVNLTWAWHMALFWGIGGCERLEHGISVLFVGMELGKDDSVRCMWGLACAACYASIGERP